MSAGQQTGPPCIIMDLAVRWRIDAALFLVLSAALLVWALAVASARTAGLEFVTATGVALLVDRLAPSLTDPATIAERSLEQPVGAYQESTARYVIMALGITIAFAAVTLVVALAVGSTSDGFAPLAGVSAAIGITRLIGVRRLRRLEQAQRIRLSARAGRWVGGSHTYYARPDLGL